MPTLTRWFVKAALIYFVASLLIGFLLALNSIFNLQSFVFGLSPVYFHLLMVGWITQLIFGVAHWMFPKYSKEKPRGDDRLSWITYWTLNVGLIMRAIAEPLISESIVFGWAVAVSSVLQMIAGWLFVINTWGRVKEK